MRIKLKRDIWPYVKNTELYAVPFGTDWLIGCPIARITLSDGSEKVIGEYYDYEVVGSARYVQVDYNTTVSFSNIKTN